MNQSSPAHPEPGSGSLLALALLSLPVGAATGLVGALFRLTLDEADRLRGIAIGWAHGLGGIAGDTGGFLLIVAAGAAAAFVAAWMVRVLSPHASGSGIPHVEAVLNRELKPASFLLLPVKFVGGVLAIGSGLALGREGPSVQMGASIGHMVGEAFRQRMRELGYVEGKNVSVIVRAADYDSGRTAQFAAELGDGKVDVEVLRAHLARASRKRCEKGGAVASDQVLQIHAAGACLREVIVEPAGERGVHVGDGARGVGGKEARRRVVEEVDGVLEFLEDILVALALARKERERWRKIAADSGARAD